MALIEPVDFISKKGKKIRIRCLAIEEAQNLLSAMIEIAETSPFILSTADDFRKMSLEDEVKFIKRHNERERALLLVAEFENKIIGILNFSADAKKKNHRGYIGISLHHDFRGEGIAKKLFDVLLEFSRKLPNLKYLELDLIDINQDAYELYKRVGFKLIHELPEAFELEDGRMVGNYFMRMNIQ